MDGTDGLEERSARGRVSQSQCRVGWSPRISTTPPGFEISAPFALLFFTLNREDFSFVIHLDRQPRTSRRREAQTGSRARSGSRSERTLDAVEHSRTLMEWWPFLIFHRGGLRIKVINNSIFGHDDRHLAKTAGNSYYPYLYLPRQPPTPPATIAETFLEWDFVILFILLWN